jgi:hypothetical protein
VLVAEIAESVKRPHNGSMRPHENWVQKGSFARRRSWGAGGRLGVLFLFVTSAVGLAACGPRPMPPGYAADDARAFVREHRAELEKEIATGSGPRIYDLAILANCQDVPQLGRRLHRSQGNFFGPSGTLAEGGATVGSPAAGPVPDADVADRIVRFMEERRELRCINLDRTRSSQWVAGRRQIGPRRSATTARGGTP